MQITIKELREIIIEEIKKQKKYYFGGSHPDEDYEVELLRDPAYSSPSVYVPDDIKYKIDNWASDMKLTSKPRKSKKSNSSNRSRIS